MEKLILHPTPIPSKFNAVIGGGSGVEDLPGKLDLGHQRIPCYLLTYLPTNLPTSILNPSATDSFRYVIQLASFLSFCTPPPPPHKILASSLACLTVNLSSEARRDFVSARSQLGTLSSPPAVLYIYISCWREGGRVLKAR